MESLSKKLESNDDVDLITLAKQKSNYRKNILTFQEMTVQLRKLFHEKKKIKEQKKNQVVTAPIQVMEPRFSKIKKKISMVQNRPHVKEETKRKSIESKAEKGNFLQIIDQKQGARVLRSQNGYIEINDYQIQELLGRGSFANVYICKNKLTNKIYAVKILDELKIRKKIFGKSVTEDPILIMRREISILSHLSHPNIIKLIDVIQDEVEKKIYVIMEYCKNGAINSPLNKNNLLENEPQKSSNRILTESQLKSYMKNILLALDYLHNSIKLAHRDIKPQNLLLDENNIVKIADFGLSTTDIQSEDKSGTRVFMAPECFKKQKYDPKRGDIWSLGITMLILLTGQIPYPQPFNEFDLKNIIQKHEFEYDPKTMSKNLINFLEKSLEKNWQKRATVEQLMKHPWITGDHKIQLKNSYHENGEIKERGYLNESKILANKRTL